LGWGRGEGELRIKEAEVRVGRGQKTAIKKKCLEQIANARRQGKRRKKVCNMNLRRTARMKTACDVRDRRGIGGYHCLVQRKGRRCSDRTLTRKKRRMPASRGVGLAEKNSEG